MKIFRVGGEGGEQKKYQKMESTEAEK